MSLTVARLGRIFTAFRYSKLDVYYGKHFSIRNASVFYEKSAYSLKGSKKKSRI